MAFLKYRVTLRSMDPFVRVLLHELKAVVEKFKECVTIDHSLRRFAVNSSIAKRILEIRKLIFHMARFPLFTQANYIE